MTDGYGSVAIDSDRVEAAAADLFARVYEATIAAHPEWTNAA